MLVQATHRPHTAALTVSLLRPILSTVMSISSMTAVRLSVPIATSQRLEISEELHEVDVIFIL